MRFRADGYADMRGLTCSGRDLPTVFCLHRWPCSLSRIEGLVGFRAPSHNVHLVLALRLGCSSSLVCCRVGSCGILVRRMVAGGWDRVTIRMRC